MHIYWLYITKVYNGKSLWGLNRWSMSYAKDEVWLSDDNERTCSTSKGYYNCVIPRDALASSTLPTRGSSISSSLVGYKNCELHQILSPNPANTQDTAKLGEGL